MDYGIKEELRRGGKDLNNRAGAEIAALLVTVEKGSVDLVLILSRS